ncbi:MAG TPA: hypothetical protein VNP04_16345 [Alphaproteobacteria bacterium]|nr:hypothetical protein [Alphaproteobacteria bacterium]
MAVLGGGDGIEIFGYFAGFWLFIFNKRFRGAWLEAFKREGSLERAFCLFQATISVFCGLVLPLFLLGWALRGWGVV